MSYIVANCDLESKIFWISWKSRRTLTLIVHVTRSCSVFGPILKLTQKSPNKYWTIWIRALNCCTTLHWKSIALLWLQNTGDPMDGWSLLSPFTRCKLRERVTNTYCIFTYQMLKSSDSEHFLFHLDQINVQSLASPLLQTNAFRPKTSNLQKRLSLFKKKKKRHWRQV